MYEIKSNFIKSKIKGKSFTNNNQREYISRLITLEKLVSRDIVLGYMEKRTLDELRERYPKEYFSLLKELKPSDYNFYKKVCNKGINELVRLREIELKYKSVNDFEYINIDQNIKEKRQKNLIKIQTKKTKKFDWWINYGGTI